MDADEGVSGTLASRPEWDKLIDRLEEGDEVIVWKFDRIGRNTMNVLEVVKTIAGKGATFHSLAERIDTSGWSGSALQPSTRCSRLSETPRSGRRSARTLTCLAG